MNRPNQITIRIVTRDRFESLLRCVRSLDLLAHLVLEVLIVDDAGDRTLPKRLREKAGGCAGAIRFLPHTAGAGYISGRNRIAAEAATNFILNLDDDAYLREGNGFEEALSIFADNSSVAAIALRQLNPDGSPWPAAFQPAPVDYPCEVPCFIGFGHILRREAFFRAGGYREFFHFYGEEKDLGLRLFAAGFRVIYLPQLGVVHSPDPQGRNMSRYLRYTVRNDCLNALLNFPLLLVPAAVLWRFWGYFRMRRAWKVSDPGGFSWILRELVRLRHTVWPLRNCLSWGVLRSWRRLRQHWPEYSCGEGPRGDSTRRRLRAVQNTSKLTPTLYKIRSKSVSNSTQEKDK